ncbi:MAG: ATP-dependent Clp protease adaptor ClpS [Tepidisphaeraceae bacterium]
MPAETSTAVEKRPTPAAKERAKKPSQLPPYHVVLLDDNDHSHEYVMEMMKVLFGYPAAMGYTLADTVDRRGRAIVFTTHRELAELKCQQIQGFGNDWRVATCRGSMTAVIVKAEDDENEK